MAERDYEQDTTVADGVLRIRARGRAVLSNPMTNRGTAFTDEERTVLGIHGLVPTGFTTLENQTRRVYEQFRNTGTMLGKFLTLNALRDRNEVLFYHLLTDHLEEMLPVIYTPTIGEAIERFSHTYNRPRGVFLSIDRPDQIDASRCATTASAPTTSTWSASPTPRASSASATRASAASRSPSASSSVYTAAAGIHPAAPSPSCSTSAPTTSAC